MLVNEIKQERITPLEVCLFVSQEKNIYFTNTHIHSKKYKEKLVIDYILVNYMGWGGGFHAGSSPRTSDSLLFNMAVGCTRDVF